MRENLRVCPICHATFEYNQNRKIYCSRDCFNKRGRKPRKCATCGCDISYVKGKDSKYCSMECSLNRYKGSIYVAEKDRSSRVWNCKSFLKKHHEDLKDDPERLTTGFLKELMGCSCGISETGIEWTT